MKFILPFILLVNFCFTQKFKPFEGKLVYQIELSDSLSKKPIETKFMTVFTNDTIVRIESESNQLGNQVLIKHLLLNKYYILLEVNHIKYAIQHQETNDTTPSKYEYKRKFGSKKFDGKKAKKISVNAKHFDHPIEMYYFKDMNPKYLDAMKGIPGLPAEYYLNTEDGIYHYKLIRILEEKTPKELFGIPKEYKKLSFDEFMDLMMEVNN